MLSEISQSEKDKYHRIYPHVESNEQTELTSKTETDSEVESRWQRVGGGAGAVEGGGMEQKGKRTHGHGQQCGDFWGAGL